MASGIGAAAICALPPFSGFASEWLLLQGLLRGFAAHGAAIGAVLLAGVAALAMTGGLTAAAFVKAAGIGFLGQPRTPDAAAAAEVGPAMVAGTALLAVPCVVLGVVPGVVLPALGKAAAGVLGPAPAGRLRAGIGAEAASATDVIQPALLAALLLALLIGIWAVLRVWARARVRAQAGAGRGRGRAAAGGGVGVRRRAADGPDGVHGDIVRRAAAAGLRRRAAPQP